MKVGDLVRYVSPDQTDFAIGIIMKIMSDTCLSWADVLWSADEGTYHDEVVLLDLEVIG